MPNPRLDWMDKNVALEIDGGDAAIILGLVTSEWAEVRGESVQRESYFQTLDQLRQKLIAIQPK